MEIKEKVFLVVGTGVSGVAAAELLLEENAKVYLFDGNKDLDVEALLEKHPKMQQTQILLEHIPVDVLEETDIAVLSPGVPTDTEFVKNLQKHQILIWGEIELAYRCGKGQVVAITGTNGKTTTTSLVGHIMKLFFEYVFVVGNIGIPYTAVAKETTEDSVTVAEISSFQLETIDAFAPRITAILNITPDHLNRHHTMENYIAAKESITKNQGEQDICVLNYEDDVLRSFGKQCKQKVVFFSSQQKLEDGLFVEDDCIVWARENGKETILPVEKMNILGAHNQENAMAAIAMCHGMGVPMDVIRQGLSTFQAVEHRIEFVCSKNNIDFYNDSKGTNPDAAIKGIQAMNRKTVLIGGGYDKESTYDAWLDSFQGKVKKLVLIGQTREKIADCAKAHGFTEYVFAESLEEAIDISYQVAEPGEAVLLSPACASWGMFDNYEQRGCVFKEYVKGLKE